MLLAQWRLRMGFGAPTSSPVQFPKNSSGLVAPGRPCCARRGPRNSPFSDCVSLRQRFLQSAESPLKQHSPHPRGASVNHELIHVHAGRRGVASCFYVLTIPARDVIPACEIEIRESPALRWGGGGVTRCALDEHGYAHDLGQDVVDPKGHGVVLRARGALGATDRERYRRLLRERIRLVLTERSTPPTFVAALLGRLTRRGRGKEHARNDPEGK